MIYQNIASLIKKSLEVKLIKNADIVYCRNQILSLLNLKSWPHHFVSEINSTIPDLLDSITEFAIEHGVIIDTFDDKEMLKANMMNCLVARPSVINDKFYKEYKKSPKNATDYFYRLSKNSNYIQTKRIDKNIHFPIDTNYGRMDITINLSKPEKDPQSIKKETDSKSNNINYPTCVLCRESEGYEGRVGYPPRSNHRVVNIPLLNEEWFFQYSPYTYYNEHSILLSKEHRNMKIDYSTFERLLTFVEKFPHYFIGSNADLPIVGGSILSHDHYQAGKYKFGMETAKESFIFQLQDFKQVRASYLEWPLSVIRLQGDKETLTKASDHILNKWINYTDEQANIIPFTERTRHNTITPIARKVDNDFEIDLVLRNNRTTVEHPLGLFHPGDDVQHIKKENIGLIEVMGLAVLPARLAKELTELKGFLLGESNQISSIHEKWANELKLKYDTFENINQIIQHELGLKFTKVLEDAGVFKQNKEGINAVKRFINTLNK